MDLITILEKTVSPDQNELRTAQQFLEDAAQQNLPELLKQLSEILKLTSNSPVARMQSGIQLKNALYSKDSSVRTQYMQRWLSFEENLRNYIKQNVLESLGTETFHPSSAAQCVAYIACAELPHQLWPNLIQILTDNVTAAGSTEPVRQATLEALGYICQDIEPEVLQSQSNQILTAIVHGMKKDEPSENVRVAATNALLNSLEFTRANFDKESERHFLMQVVCEATQSSSTSVRVAALQCLVRIMSLYYNHMEHYMGPALFAITLDAMRSDGDAISLQGIEFWSTVCDEELDLAIEAAEAMELGRPPAKVSRFYAKGALQFLAPLLLQTLPRGAVDEDDDDDDWTPAKAAGVCLMLLATTCEDDVLPHVLPFVNDNIVSADWRHRDAAVLAFGSILEGPNIETLRPVVQQAMPTLIEMVRGDASLAVRDTSAWTIGRVCDVLRDVVLHDSLVQPLLNALGDALRAESRVATNVCWALSSLADAAADQAHAQTNGVHVDDADDTLHTFALSPYFRAIVAGLLDTTERPDANTHNLKSAAYEALMELIKNAPKDCYEVIQRCAQVVLERLQKVTVHGTTSDNVDVQSLLCACLQVVLRKLQKEDLPVIADPAMSALMSVLSPPNGSLPHGGVHEDALLAIAALVEVMDTGFTKYMPHLVPIVETALQRYDEEAVCSAAVGLVGDICRALNTDIQPYADMLMNRLLTLLGAENVPRNLKPPVLGVIGDMALAMGPQFTKYAQVVLNGMLQQAAQAAIHQPDDADVMDYINELREGCLEAYTGIVQGTKEDSRQLLEPSVMNMVNLLQAIEASPDSSDAVLAAACGLIGDLLTTFKGAALQALDIPGVLSLLQKARRSKTQKTKSLGNWATREMRKLKNNMNASS